MAEVNFDFEGNKIIIQCKLTDKMEEICLKFSNKINININKLIFIYGGGKVYKELTLENQANDIDLVNKSMNILVYKIEFSQTGKIEINTEQNLLNELKNKIYLILVKYLEDREYIENKVANWIQAILNEINPLFLNYKDYKTFVHVLVKNETIKNKNFSRYHNFKNNSGKNFSVKFKNTKIFGLVNVHMFNINIKRTKKDITNFFDSTLNNFLNLAEGREFDIYIQKYHKMFQDKFNEEYNLNYKDKSICVFYDLSNKYNMVSYGSNFINEGENDCILSKEVKTDKWSFYFLMANIQ